MILNYYFHYPVGVENVDAENIIYNHDVLFPEMSCELYRRLKKFYPEIQINPINTHMNPKALAHGPSGKYTPASVVIENPDTKKYMVISYIDNLTRVNEGTGWDLENCVDFFAGGGVQEDDISYKYSGFKYTPFAFYTFFKSALQEIEKQYKKEKHIPDKLFFRGEKYLFREYLSNNDNRFNIKHDRLPGNEFIREVSNYSINIDLNSVYEISCRTYDMLGLKTALIRPELTVQYHNPLIPDYHYASIKKEYLTDYKILADAYIEKFEELKKDPDYVHFLSENGRKWYEENCTIESCLNLQLKIINLYKLQ